MSWRDGLDGVFLEIAATDEPVLRVLAGPGTGKTFALMKRLARLLEEGAAPRRLLVVTFTRTAATDLVRKLGEMRVEGARTVRAATLHSLCFGLLQTEHALLATGRIARPLLSFETHFLVADLKAQFGGVREAKRMIRAFESAWATLQSQEPGWPIGPRDRQFHGALDSWLRFHQAMLVGELVPEALRFLRMNPLSSFLRHYRHVLVDEYQDLNKAEQSLVDLLARGASVGVFGDEDQSIYGFKFAHPEGIVDFPATHGGTADFPLEDCRRCPTRVVAAARELISHNPRLTAKTLREYGSNPVGDIATVQWESLEEEADGLASFVTDYTRGGRVALGEVLVLAPRRLIGYSIRDALRARGVAANSYFHEEELETSAAAERFALLTLLVNPSDRVALRAWIGLQLPQEGIAPWRRLRDHCEQSGEPPLDAMRAISAGSLTLPYTSGLAAALDRLHREFQSLEGLVGQPLVDQWLPQGMGDTEDLRRLTDEIVGNDTTPAELLLRLTQTLIRPEPPVEADAVRVMSLHKSKGLTGDVVVVAGCVEGLIPTLDARLTTAEIDRQLQEQRRLFFVAVTRARRFLVLSGARWFPLALAYRMNMPVQRRAGLRARTVATRFLGELGPYAPEAQDGREWLRQMSA